MDGINAANTANATLQVAAALQMFALKQANQGQAAVLDALLQTIAPSPAHLGNKVDTSA